MRRFARLLRRLLAVAALLVLLAASGAAGLLWLTLPPDSARVRIPGLAAPVDVTFDQDGVARIRAGSETDAAAALGYVHARARMAQMELMRRAVSGRLAEIAGPRAVRLDRTMRTLGLRQAALADYATLPADARAVLEAYARGVNAWIAARGRFAAPEFLLIGAPEPWEPTDSMLWAKYMGLWLSMDYDAELARMEVAPHLTAKALAELWPAAQGVLPPDATLDVRHADAAGALLRALPAFPDPFTLPSTASNEWAVDARHSSSGAPLLAGDPHLSFGQPGLWYLARIETPAGVLAGATAPGAPFLVIGHNARIAWTFTNTGADVQDIFVETPVDAGHYLGPDGPLPYGVREERIRVRGGPDVVFTVRATRHGPVISDLTAGDGTARDATVLAVAMANLAPNDTSAAGLLALDRARDVTEAGRAAALISSPVQNLLVADRAHIGLFMTGRIPIRRAPEGLLPAAGADGAHDWTGFASGDALPHIVDPPSGRLVNANERPAPAGTQVFLGTNWFGDWRAQRIRALLTARDGFTVEAFAAMQTDEISVYAAALLPRLRSVPAAAGLPAIGLGLLQAWDGRIARERPEPLIFNAWLGAFHDAVMRRAGLPVSSPASPHLEFTAFLLSPEGAGWCGGDCTPILAETLATTMAELAGRYGDNPHAWQWGAAHQAVFANSLLRSLPLIGSLTTARIEDGGDDSTVQRASFAAGSFDAIHGAAYRGAYDLADLDRSRFIVTPGQSGNPLSRHATDLMARWRDGATLTLGPTPKRVEATLSLLP